MGWIIYLAGVVDNLQGFLVIFAIMATLAAGIGVMGISVNTGFDEKGDYSAPRKLVIAAMICGVIASCLPSATTIYMIVGANIAEAQITSDEGQEIIGKVRQLVVQKLDEAIADGSK